MSRLADHRFRLGMDGQREVIHLLQSTEGGGHLDGGRGGGLVVPLDVDRGGALTADDAACGGGINGPGEGLPVGGSRCREGVAGDLAFAGASADEVHWCDRQIRFEVVGGCGGAVWRCAVSRDREGVR